MSKKRVGYSDTFKAEAIAKVKENNGNLSQTAKELGIPMNTLANWHRKAETWINHYNNDRPNMGNGGFTPIQKLNMAA